MAKIENINRTKEVRNSVLAEAQAIVYGPREKDYGHPKKNYQHTANLLNAHFEDKLIEKFTPEDIVQMMILLKLSRQAHKPKRDNLVDISGYAEVENRIRS